MFVEPEKNLQQFNLSPGQQVADLGAGSGFYTLAAAKLVGGAGRVFAVEIQKDMLSRLKNLAAAEHLSNVEVIWGDVERLGGTNLKDNSVDRAIVSNLLFQAENRAALVEEVKRILKPGGKSMVIDWSDSSGLIGSGLKLVPKDETVKLFEVAGFSQEKEINAGDHHYGLIFKKE